ncbi:hypothetical protein GTO27_10925, partial [Candidatus Bathyarchaeota archaeon]|nr:hypothetical protein [Candidatus Bathyarchaeota archaeon]
MVFNVSPVKAQPFVKVYVEDLTGLVTPPAGPYPVYYFQIDIYMESSGITKSNGIIYWAMDVQFNPDVHDLTYGVAYGSSFSYSLYEFWDVNRQAVGSPL